MSNLTGALNSTQVNTLVDQPVLMFKIFAVIFVLIIIAGAGYAIWNLFK